jgi:hypothetical protein
MEPSLARSIIPAGTTGLANSGSISKTGELLDALNAADDDTPVRSAVD